jgi:8-oxo-dGTP pyrophosphatase MutT (NUDIX family)
VLTGGCDCAKSATSMDSGAVRSKDEPAIGGAAQILRHFCASAYVYDVVANKFLFVRHRRLRLWIPPGGHIEKNERPDVAALREVAEETGIDARLVGAPSPVFDGEVAMVQPFALRVYGVEPGHEHMNFIYGAVPIGGELLASERDAEDVGWFSVEDVMGESFAAPLDVRAWCRYLSSDPMARFFMDR